MGKKGGTFFRTYIHVKNEIGSDGGEGKRHWLDKLRIKTHKEVVKVRDPPPRSISSACSCRPRARARRNLVISAARTDSPFQCAHRKIPVAVAMSHSDLVTALQSVGHRGVQSVHPPAPTLLYVPIQGVDRFVLLQPEHD